MRDPYEKYHENSIIKHVEQIQRKSERGQTNSFLIKGFALTTILIFFTFYIKLNLEIQEKINWIILIPLSFLWYLDAKDSRQFKLYDRLYTKIFFNKINKIGEMNIQKVKSDYHSTLYFLFFNQDVSFFYYMLFILVSIIFFSQFLIYPILLAFSIAGSLFILRLIVTSKFKKKK